MLVGHLYIILVADFAAAHGCFIQQYNRFSEYWPVVLRYSPPAPLRSVHIPDVVFLLCSQQN